MIKLRFLAQAPVALPHLFAIHKVLLQSRLISTQNSSQIALVQLCGYAVLPKADQMRQTAISIIPAQLFIFFKQHTEFPLIWQ